MTNLRVTQALEALKVEHSAYQPTDDGLMRVHVMIPRPDAPALALMFSGFGDYVLNGDKKYAENGPVAMETEMLQALGWHVVWPHPRCFLGHQCFPFSGCIGLATRNLFIFITKHINC